jgi:Arc/MetJ-type ribon-helix-helix transcriptional regulator
MKKYTKRIAIRLTEDMEETLNQKIKEGRFKNLSQAVRFYLENYVMSDLNMEKIVKAGKVKEFIKHFQSPTEFVKRENL